MPDSTRYRRLYLSTTDHLDPYLTLIPHFNVTFLSDGYDAESNTTSIPLDSAILLGYNVPVTFQACV